MIGCYVLLLVVSTHAQLGSEGDRFTIRVDVFVGCDVMAVPQHPLLQQDQSHNIHDVLIKPYSSFSVSQHQYGILTNMSCCCVAISYDGLISLKYTDVIKSLSPLLHLYSWGLIAFSCQSHPDISVYLSVSSTEINEIIKY